MPGWLTQMSPQVPKVSDFCPHVTTGIASRRRKPPGDTGTYLRARPCAQNATKIGSLQAHGSAKAQKQLCQRSLLSLEPKARLKLASSYERG